MQHLKYRPEIDGLRAVAVVGVIMFHAFPSVFTGGFVGVDVFFVISGYLISLIIYKCLNSDSFSFLEFYIHRIRRIFPALILVLVTCLILGKWIMFTDEFRNLAKHALGGVMFLSNIVLWNESGYFDKDVYFKPLMHLWSLGVEEQFYLVWPLLLVGLWRRIKSLWPMIAILCGTSFVYCLYKTYNFPATGFFSPLARFWELGVGALAGYYNFKNNSLELANGKRYMAFIEATVVFSIVAPYFLYDDSTKFPGFAAALPVFGAVAVLVLLNTKTVTMRLLSSWPMVAIGKISYPLYLWHWPLISMLYVVEGERPPIQFIYYALILTFILSTLTYNFVERPIRFGKHEKLFSLLLLTVLVLVGIYSFGEYEPVNFFELVIGKTL